MRYRATLQIAELLLGAGQNGIRKHNWFLRFGCCCSLAAVLPDLAINSTAEQGEDMQARVISCY